MLREGGDIQVGLSLDDAMRLLLGTPTGRVNVRGGNGSGKSTLLATLKGEIKNRAYYWPTTDRLAFQFCPQGARDRRRRGRGDAETAQAKAPGFSSGERQINSLQEIVAHTDAPIYLLDEWDANLDPGQPRRRRCAGRTACAARARHRDFASRCTKRSGTESSV